MALYNPYTGGKPVDPFTGEKTVTYQDGITGDEQNSIPNMVTKNTPEYDAYLKEVAPTLPIATGGRKAADILADVTRAQWDDVKRNFLPIESDILQQLTFVNKDLLPESIASAQQASGGMSDTVAGVRDRNIARYGMNMGSQDQQAMADSDALTKSKNMVNAGNWTRQRLIDRDKELMLGGISATNG